MTKNEQIIAALVANLTGEALAHELRKFLASIERKDK